MADQAEDSGGESGDIDSFEENWQQRKEAEYNHWTPQRPQNQIQLAFRNHWEVFSEYLVEDEITEGKCLEVGCGRGSISSYFADAGFDCYLLDTSVSALQTATKIFHTNSHQGHFLAGDAVNLPLESGSFDVVVSIGLLEHFSDVARVIDEQIRVLRPGGRFFGYVVPENEQNIQRYFEWINSLLKILVPLTTDDNQTEKAEVFRTDDGGDTYRRLLEERQVENIEAFGMYPIPMISHSPEFPFTLLPSPLEKLYTNIADASLRVRGMLVGKHPWTCRESIGQAFLVTCTKAK